MTVSVHTVEHVLAAVAGCGFDDVEIRLDGPEPPIMDGSAAPFVDALVTAGVLEQPVEVQYLTLRRPMTFADGESRYEVTPSRELELDVTIDFAHPMIGVQRCSYRHARGAFATEIGSSADVRVHAQVDALRSMGLIQGASLDNAVVLDDTAVVGALRPLARRIRATQDAGLSGISPSPGCEYGRESRPSSQVTAGRFNWFGRCSTPRGKRP
jgi:UDP-3-O-acyl-N-acetylglucosamine deacetylase